MTFFVRSEIIAGRSTGTTMPGATTVSNFPSLTSASRTPAKSFTHWKRNAYVTEAFGASVRLLVGRRQLPPAALAAALAAFAWMYGVYAPPELSKYSSFVSATGVINRYGPT